MNELGHPIRPVKVIILFGRFLNIMPTQTEGGKGEFHE